MIKSSPYNGINAGTAKDYKKLSIAQLSTVIQIHKSGPTYKQDYKASDKAESNMPCLKIIRVL